MTASAQTLLWYAVAVVGLIGVIMSLSFVLGERHRGRATGQPYESGIAPTGSGRLRIPVQFYLLAILFVIFDLELVFIFAWAVVVREVGWVGFWEMSVFVGVLLVALFYVWRIGVLGGSDPEVDHSVRITR